MKKSGSGPFDVYWDKKAKKQFLKLSHKIQSRLNKTIIKLAYPFSLDIKKLKGYNDVYRIREEDYRLIIIIEISNQDVVIIRVGHRKNIYKGL